MNNLLSFFLFLLSSSSLLGQNNNEYPKLISDANDFYKKKEFKQSTNKFEQAFRLNNSKDFYDAACSYTLIGKYTKALEYLKKSVKYGWNNVEHMKSDSNLNQLHSFNDWENIITSTKKNKSKTLTVNQLRDKIISLILLNNSNEIWELCSDDFTSNTNNNDFNKKLDLIYSILNKEKIKNLELKNPSYNISTKFSYNVKTRVTSEFNYTIIPNNFRFYIKNLLVEPLGYNIKIELIEKNYNWYLSKILLENNYFDSKYQMKTEIDNFYKNKDSLSVNFSITKNNKTYNNKSKFKKQQINNLLNKFKRIEYVKFSDLEKIKHKISIDSSKVHSISYKPYNIRIFKHPKEEKKIDKFQFIYFKDKKNLVWISNGINYAFYKIKYIKN